ncbi:hypothetical protein A2U01_0048184, partial [Trifolium medium]|nr:hypothetical protein [Trifolium medium]
SAARRKQILPSSGVRVVRSLDGEHLQVSPSTKRTVKMLTFWKANTGSVRFLESEHLCCRILPTLQKLK